MNGILQIEPNTIYADSGLRLALGLTSATLARARRKGDLRCARKGKQILYLGQWVLDWISEDTGKAGVTKVR